jgi:hypothetical protein
MTKSWNKHALVVAVCFRCHEPALLNSMVHQKSKITESEFWSRFLDQFGWIQWKLYRITNLDPIEYVDFVNPMMDPQCLRWHGCRLLHVGIFGRRSWTIIHNIYTAWWTRWGGSSGVGVVLGQLKRGVEGAGCGVTADGQSNNLYIMQSYDGLNLDHRKLDRHK